MKKVILGLLLVFLVTIRPAHAHKEWVHQYMVQQAYLFLENQIGTIPVLKTATGIDLRGPGAHFHGPGSMLNYNLPQISVGAWREDVDDWIYGYGDSYSNGVTPSITHFWKADAGDDARSVYLNGPAYENAWEKARIFLFCYNSRGGSHSITVPFSDGYITRNYIITYNSLPDLYRGDYYLEGVSNIGGGGYVNLNHAATHYPAFGQPVALQILGRVAHLLGDMSVPAHAHAHLHPCPAHLTDFYENNMGNVFWDDDHPDTDCEEDPYPNDGNYRAKQWSAATAAQTGGLLQQAYCQSGPLAFMRYLFYTTNQLGDYFPSGETFSQRTDPAGPAFHAPPFGQLVADGNYFVDGNNNLPNLTDPSANADLQNLYGPMINKYGVSPDDIIYQDIATETFNYSIRSVATLFQWFAYNAGLIQTLDNSGRIMSSSNNAMCPGSAPVNFLVNSQSPVTSPITWSVEPAYAATGVLKRLYFFNVYEVTPTADTQAGPVTVKAEYTTTYGCYSYPVVLTKSIWKGPPGLSLSTPYANIVGDVDPGTTIGLESSMPGYVPDGNTTYTWSSDNGSYIHASGSSATLYAPVSDYGVSFSATVVATNACGTSTSTRGFRTRDEHPPRCVGCPEDTYRTAGAAPATPPPPASKPGVAAPASGKRPQVDFEISPNPSSGVFDIYYLSSARLEARAEQDHPSFTLLDALGRTVADGILSKTTTHMVVEGLNAGVYSLKVIDGGQVRYKRIQIAL